jgi:hypothetical protein
MDIPKGALPIFQQPLSFVRFPITEHHWNAPEPTPYITDLEKLREATITYTPLLLLLSFCGICLQNTEKKKIILDLKLESLLPMSVRNYYERNN